MFAVMGLLKKEKIVTVEDHLVVEMIPVVIQTLVNSLLVHSVMIVTTYVVQTADLHLKTHFVDQRKVNAIYLNFVQETL
jgi:hypothetical protein